MLAVGVEQVPGRTVARLPHPELSLTAAAVSERSDPDGVSLSLGGERGRGLESRCGAFRLLDGGGLY